MTFRPRTSQVQMSPYRHRVSLQDGVDLAEVEELILLQEARLSPHGVQHWSCMTLRRQKDQWLQ